MSTETTIEWHTDPNGFECLVANPAPGVGMSVEPIIASNGRFYWSVWRLLRRIGSGTADTEAEAKARAEEAYRRWAQ